MKWFVAEIGNGYCLGLTWPLLKWISMPWSFACMFLQMAHGTLVAVFLVILVDAIVGVLIRVTCVFFSPTGVVRQGVDPVTAGLICCICVSWSCVRGARWWIFSAGFVVYMCAMLRVDERAPIFTSKFVFSLYFSAV